jgi:hypothetical protein
MRFERHSRPAVKNPAFHHGHRRYPDYTPQKLSDLSPSPDPHPRASRMSFDSLAFTALAQGYY